MKRRLALILLRLAIFSTRRLLPRGSPNSWVDAERLAPMFWSEIPDELSCHTTGFGLLLTMRFRISAR